MVLKQLVISFGALVMSSSLALADSLDDDRGTPNSPTTADELRNATPYVVNGDESDLEGSDELSNGSIYRGGDVDAGELDPWGVPSPDTNDSQILEDQMSPDPTVEYDQQLYD